MDSDPIKKIRVKIKKYLPSQVFREDINRGLTRSGEHLFYRMSMSFEDALEVYDQVAEKVKASYFTDDVEIVNLSHPEDTQEFMFLYNAIFMAAPDPSRTITLEEASYFPESQTFIVKIWGMMAGFIYLVTEKDPLGSGDKVGAIAGIGVLPKYRGRRLGLLMIKHAIDYFKVQDPPVKQLICEVYSENNPSLAMFKGLGMEIVGHMILEDEELEEPETT